MLPKYNEIHLPLLEELVLRGGKSRPSDHRDGKNIYQSLACHFGLKKDDLEREVQSENKWENMVRWAKNDLVKLGFIDKSEYGVWKLTEKGEALAKLNDPLLYQELLTLLRRKK